MSTVAHTRNSTTPIYRNTLLTLVGRIFISLMIAAPFLLGAAYSLTTSDAPTWVPMALAGIGGVLILVGLYMSFASAFPSCPLVAGEEALVVRHPTMRPAFARMFLSLPFFLGAGYLFVLTELPYVYPFVLFLLGMFLFFKGAVRYWVNLHVTYTVTNRRVISMYRFLWLHTTEIPVSRIISISEARSFFEILTGRGSVVVASGIGSRQTIRIEDISDPGPVGEVLRGLLP